MMCDDISKDYRRAEEGAIDKLNSEATEIANSLGIGDRMQKFNQNQAFCSIKDHKAEFDVTNPNSVKRRLINPAKSDIGVVSKVILQKIIDKVKTETKLASWQSTQETLDWFLELPRGQNLSFLSYDIENFYPSITPEVLKNHMILPNNTLKSQKTK